MNLKKHFRSMYSCLLAVSTVAVLLLASTELVLAQMPVRPMPGTPGQPMPGTPGPQPAPQPMPPPHQPMPPPHPQPPPQPYPQPQPMPPPSYGCYLDLCVGDRVINITRDSREVIIEAIEPQGTYLLRFLDTNGVGGNWSRSDLAVERGCSGDICVGTRAFNVSRDYREISVVAIDYFGRFVVRFFDTNGVGSGWNRSDLAVEQGCGQYFCVGNFARNIQRNYRQVQIVGIEFNGTYVLRFLDNNNVGGRWTDADLVR